MPGTDGARRRILRQYRLCVVGSYHLSLARRIDLADSSSSTTRRVGSAVPERRGATMAVHSMLGYFGGLIGLLVQGIVPDLAAGTSPPA